MIQPQAIVLCGDGINCDKETADALNLAGFEAIRLHISTFLDNPHQLFQAHLFAIPGGFSFGDEIASGKVLAIKIKQTLSEVLYSFIESNKMVLGICNGFQVLVQLGLLPYSKHQAPRVVSLLKNAHGKFVNKWVELSVNEMNPAPFFQSLKRIQLPIRHGEGRLFVLEEEDDTIKRDIINQAALFYCHDVNGSWHNIAALTNSSGNVLGLMPHPEAFVRWSQHPAWKSTTTLLEGTPNACSHKNAYLPDGLAILKNARNALD